MKKIFFPLIALVLLLTGCLDGGETRPSFYGFATVVKSPYTTTIQMKTDNGYSLNAIGFDDKELLKHNDRVLMSCLVDKDYSNKTYDVTLQTCTYNLAYKIAEATDFIDDQFPDSVIAHKGITLQDAVISRDYLGRDFLNLNYYYYSKDKNKDYVGMVYRPEDQTTAGEVVLWLHHSQTEASTSVRYTDIRCFELNKYRQTGLNKVKLIVKYTEGTGSVLTEQSRTIEYVYAVESTPTN